MARQGLAALTGGIKEGYEFVDERKKAKQIRELLGRENVRLKRKAIAEGKDVERMAPGEFDFETYTPPMTFGQKLMGKVKSMFAGQPQAIQPQQAAPMNPQVQPSGPQALPAQQFADGGAVRHMRKKYDHGGRVVSEEDKERYRRLTEEGRGGGTGGGIGEYGRDVARAADERFFPNTRRTFKQASQAIGAELADVTAPGLTTAQRGRETREYLGETAKGTLATGYAVVEDTGIPGAIRGAGEFAKGFLGYGLDPDQAAAAQAIPRDETPEQMAGEMGSPTAPAGQATQAATPAPSSNIRGAVADEVDFSTQAREVMPEDLPVHSSKDWGEERNYWAASAIMKGQDPFEAMKKVDQEQSAGFSRYAMQATALMDGGDMEGAARALYAAYQYFPNGKNVKFGIQQGRDGNRVIVAMGSDEETGKPSGPPQILDRNTVSRMVENLQKPGALRAWTTDWQATEGKLWQQGYSQDVLKETGRHNRAMEAVGLARVEATGKTGGAKPADYDRANKAFQEAVSLESFENEEQADFMMSLMAQIYSNFGAKGAGGLQYPTVIEEVRKAIRSKDFTQLDDKYGIQ